jgi:hypothetical protein
MSLTTMTAPSPLRRASRRRHDPLPYKTSSSRDNPKADWYIWHDAKT